jgi:hypothetical protein
MVNRRDFLSFLAAFASKPTSVFDGTVAVAASSNSISSIATSVLPNVGISLRDVDMTSSFHRCAVDIIGTVSGAYSHHTVNLDNGEDPYLEGARNVFLPKLERELSVFLKEEMEGLAKLRTSYTKTASLIGTKKLEEELERLEAFKSKVYIQACGDIVGLVPEDSEERKKLEIVATKINQTFGKKYISEMHHNHLSDAQIDAIYDIERITEEKIKAEIAATEKRLKLPEGSLAVLLEAGDRHPVFFDNGKNVAENFKDDALFSRLGKSFILPPDTDPIAHDEILGVIRKVFTEEFKKAFPDVELKDEYLPPVQAKLGQKFHQTWRKLSVEEAPKPDSHNPVHRDQEQTKGVPVSSLARVVVAAVANDGTEEKNVSSVAEGSNAQADSMATPALPAPEDNFLDSNQSILPEKNKTPQRVRGDN